MWLCLVARRTGKHDLQSTRETATMLLKRLFFFAQQAWMLSGSSLSTEGREDPPALVEPGGEPWRHSHRRELSSFSTLTMKNTPGISSWTHACLLHSPP